jgi:hypothetical protein
MIKSPANLNFKTLASISDFVFPESSQKPFQFNQTAGAWRKCKYLMFMHPNWDICNFIQNTGKVKIWIQSHLILLNMHTIENHEQTFVNKIDTPYFFLL